MKELNIGLDAGTLWQKMDAKGMMSITELKKATKLDVTRIYMALGWLSREGKVCFEEKRGALFVSLIYE